MLICHLGFELFTCIFIYANKEEILADTSGIKTTFSLHDGTDAFLEVDTIGTAEV